MTGVLEETNESYAIAKIAGIKIESHLVWMFGLTEDSPDNTFRWQIEFPFN